MRLKPFFLKLSWPFDSWFFSIIKPISMWCTQILVLSNRKYIELFGVHNQYTLRSSDKKWHHINDRIALAIDHTVARTEHRIGLYANCTLASTEMHITKCVPIEIIGAELHIKPSVRHRIIKPDGLLGPVFGTVPSEVNMIFVSVLILE